MALTDDFNRADGALGANWTKEVSGGASAVAIVSNEIQMDTEWTAHRHVYVYNASQPPNDQYAQIAYTGGDSNTNTLCGPACRFTIDGSKNGYSYTAEQDGTDGTLWRWDAGVATSINWIAAVGATNASVLKIVASAGTFIGYVDGAQKNPAAGSTADATYASGYAGFNYRSNRALANLGELDNFEATEPVAAGQPTIKRFGGLPHVAVNRGVW